MHRACPLEKIAAESTGERFMTSRRLPFRVRGSGIHGRGGFASRPIRKGERIVEYAGERISHDESIRRYGPDDPTRPIHTLLFTVDDETVIDAGRRGNPSRFLNHSCDPNTEAVDEDGRIFIEAIRDIAPGEELTYDYGFEERGPWKPEWAVMYACRCGFPKCRGTMLHWKGPRTARKPRAQEARQRRVG
jgi:SET domain-containing protein